MGEPQLVAANGTVFAVNTDGTAFTNLHNFSAKDSDGLNNDGASPVARLTISGNTLYGVAESDGSSRTVRSLAIERDHPSLLQTKMGLSRSG